MEIIFYEKKKLNMDYGSKFCTYFRRENCNPCSSNCLLYKQRIKRKSNAPNPCPFFGLFVAGQYTIINKRIILKFEEEDGNNIY